MPFVVSRTNQKIEPDQNKVLRESYIEMLERNLGKSPNYVMIDLQDNCPLYVRGEDEPAAYIELNIYGYAGGSSYADLSKEITSLYEKVLKIPGENVFINYRDVPDFSIDGMYY